MTKRKFIITYEDGATWEPPSSHWKDVASFITEWELSESSCFSTDPRKRIVNVEVKFPCVTCGHCE